MVNLLGVRGVDMGKMALSVCAGVLLAVGIVATVYHFAVQLPRERSARVDAARRLWFAEEDAGVIDDLAGSPEFQTVELKLMEEDPASPCINLTGLYFAQCETEPSHTDQQEWIDHVRPTKK
jgi:hypothetical protein